MGLTDSVGGLETKGIIGAFCCPLLILFTFYIWWLIKDGTTKETEVWVLLVILGILYAGAIYLTTEGYYVSASCIVFINFVFMIAIAAVSGLKDSEGAFASLGLTAMLSGFCATGMLTFVLYGLWSIKI